MQEYRIYTHETIVHSQINAIEKLLRRPVPFDITLNALHERSSIRFLASLSEIDLIKNDLNFKVYLKISDNSWAIHL